MQAQAKRPKVVVSLSGGMDSAVLLYHFLDQGWEVRALTIDYGQRHRREIEYAMMLASSLPLAQHVVLDISNIRNLLAGSSQTSHEVEVPEGHYAEESMKQTVVPNRNMIMLSIAAGWAVSTQSDAVAIAAHAGDHAIYPDCREPFLLAAGTAIQVGNYHQVSLLAPFLTWDKSTIVAHGSELGVPFGRTWSCYKGGLKHCGKCGTCVERREAFTIAKVSDPTEYEADA